MSLKKKINNPQFVLKKKKIINTLNFLIKKNSNKFFNKNYPNNQLFFFLKKSKLKFNNINFNKFNLLNNPIATKINFFFYFKNKFFLKKNKTSINVYFSFFFASKYNKFLTFFIFNFIEFFKKKNDIFNLSYLSKNFYVYSFFYLNFFYFLKINKKNLNNYITFFNKKNLEYKNQQSFLTYNRNFDNKLIYKYSKNFIKKLNKNKNKKNLNFFLKFNKFWYSFYKYFFYTKTTFLNFILYKKNYKYNSTFFKLLKFDWIDENTTRLTRTSFKLNPSDYFFINFNFNDKCINKINTFVNYYNSNDQFFQDNFFFLKNFSKKKKIFTNKIKSKETYLYNNINPYLLFFKNNKIIKFNLFKKIKFFNTFEFFLLFFFNPFFFKLNYFKQIFKNQQNFYSFNFINIFSYFKDYFFNTNKNYFFNTNIVPTVNFFYLIKKKMLKVFNYSKFSSLPSVIYHTSLVRFLEFSSGKKVYLNFYTFLNNNLTYNEKAQCLIWAQKVKYFRKVLGPRLFLNESIQIIYLSLKLKDPFILSNWMVSTMGKISFWKYKTFLRYIKYLLRYFFWVIFKELKIKGVKFQLKGKISVAGNARTRTVFHNVGFTSHATYNNKILYKLNLVKTFTGVLGLKLWIVF